MSWVEAMAFRESLFASFDDSAWSWRFIDLFRVSECDEIENRSENRSRNGHEPALSDGRGASSFGSDDANDFAPQFRAKTSYDDADCSPNVSGHSKRGKTPSNRGLQSEFGGVHRYAEDSSRMLLWRVVSSKATIKNGNFGTFAGSAVNSKSCHFQTIDILECSVAGDLEDCAVKVRLPADSCVASGGIKFFEINHRLILCIALVDGRALCCHFRCHPFSSNDGERRCLVGSSVLSDKRQSMTDSVEELEFSFSTASTDGEPCFHSCCWFEDSKGTVNLAASPDVRLAREGKISDTPTVHCLSFGDQSVEIQLCDTSLARRLRSGWSGILPRRAVAASRLDVSKEKGSPGNIQSLTNNGNRVVFLTAFCRHESKYDDTFIGILYGNGKFCLWSVAQKSCRAELDLFKSESKTSVVESAWIERVVDAHRGRNLVIAVGMHMFSGKALLLLIHGTITTNQVTLDELPRNIELDRKLLRGYRVVDLRAFDGLLYSIWWKPMIGNSTLLLRHHIEQNHRSEEDNDYDNADSALAAISLDTDRKSMILEDESEVCQKLNSVEEIDDYFTRRLSIPDRFSADELRRGILSCLDSVEVVARSVLHKQVSKATALATAKHEISRHVCLISDGFTGQSKEDRDLLVSSWKSLIQECENIWLQGHATLGLGPGFDGPILIRSSRATSFRSIDRAESVLLNSLTGFSDAKMTGILISLAQNFKSRVGRMLTMHMSLTPFDSGCNGLVSAIRDNLASFDLQSENVNRMMRPLIEIAGSKPSNLIEKLSLELKYIRSPISDETSRFLPSAEERKDGKGRKFIEFTWRSLQQRLQTRLEILLSALFFYVAIMNNCFPEHKKYFVFSHTMSGGRTMKALVSELAAECISLAVLVWLSRQSALAFSRSLDWIKRLTLDPTALSFSAASAPSESPSVLSFWVDNRIRNSEYGFETEDILEKAIELNRLIVPFLDHMQQYHVLSSVAAAASKLKPPDGLNCAELGYRMFRCTDDIPLYCHLLEAKACIWQACNSESGNWNNGGKAASDWHEWMAKAFGHVQMATPRHVEDEVLLEYYVMAMKLFERARNPHFALELALRALELPNCSEDNKRVLCSNAFARALDIKDYAQAFSVSRMYPQYSGLASSLSDGDKYLGQLLSIMVERGDVQKLCELPLQACGEAVWNDVIMKTLLRKIEEKSILSPIDNVKVRGQTGKRATYYHTMYAFCVRHLRLNEAAKCMFSMASRLQEEISVQYNDLWTLDSMLRLQEALQSCYSTMMLVPAYERTMFLNYRARFFWGSIDDNEEPASSSPRSDSSRGSFPVIAEQVYKMLYISKWAYKLLRMGKSDSSIPSSRLEPALLAQDLLRCGEIESTAMLLKLFKLDARSLFVFLVSQCIDEPFSSHAWKRVRAFLVDLDQRESGSREVPDKQMVVYAYDYHEIVLETFLSLRPFADLPRWLVASFYSWGKFETSVEDFGSRSFAKKRPSDFTRDPGRLLRILVKYNRLEDAKAVALDILLHIFPSDKLGLNSMKPFLPAKTLDSLLRKLGPGTTAAAELESAVKQFAVNLLESESAENHTMLKYVK